MLHLGMRLQELSHSLTVFTVARHTDMQTFQTQIQIECVLRRLDGAKVAHQLGGTLGNESPLQTEFFGISNAMIAVIGSGETGELLGMGKPVELTGVDNGAAHGNAVAVHVLGGGMGNDISTPFDGTAVNGGCKGIVNNQGYAVCVSSLGKTLDIQNSQSGVGNGLTKNGFGVGLESGFQLFVGAVRRDEREVDAHLLHGDGEQVKGAAVDGAAGHHMVATGSDIEYCVEVGSLTRGGQHSGRAAFQLRKLCSHIVVGRVLETGIEVAAGFQIEQLAHVLGGRVLESGGLDNGNLTGFAVSGGVAALNASGFNTVVAHGDDLLSDGWNEKTAFVPKVFFETKADHCFRGTTQIAPASQPDATFGVQQPLCTDAAYAWSPTDTAALELPAQEP